MTLPSSFPPVALASMSLFPFYILTVVSAPPRCPHSDRMSPSVQSSSISNVSPSGISLFLPRPHSITFPPSPFLHPYSLCPTPSNALSSTRSLSLSPHTLGLYRFTSCFPIKRRQLLLNAHCNSEGNSVALPAPTLL